MGGLLIRNFLARSRSPHKNIFLFEGQDQDFWNLGPISMCSLTGACKCNFPAFLENLGRTCSLLVHKEVALRIMAGEAISLPIYVSIDIGSVTTSL